MMQPEEFFELMIKELEVHKEMQPYYKFLGSQSSWHFRRNYFLERLRYIQQNIVDSYNAADAKSQAAMQIWDCGCGYGTTCLFLAMNGIKTFGTTLEFYFETIIKRKEYWKQYGDTSLFSFQYEDLFDKSLPVRKFDWIIIQDTLHHLEPIGEALQIFNNSLKESGKLLIVEENGSNLLQRAKLYKYRKNNLIIKMWDEKLKKEILLGNENIRSLEIWSNLLEQNGLAIIPDSVRYVRYFLPLNYKFASAEKLLQKERDIQAKSNLRKEYFFFGLNYIAKKK
jgi:SAM-dependent methyltransferase